MPNISYAGRPGLSWMVSVQFILKICIAAENRWKFVKTPILGVQGRSRSLMLVPLESSSTVLDMISSKSVSICNRFHARWANSGKITISKGEGGTPFWCPRSRGISYPFGTKLPHRKLGTLGYHMVKTRSLYLTWQWIRTASWRTDRQTDRQTDKNPIANTRLSSAWRHSCGA